MKNLMTSQHAFVDELRERLGLPEHLTRFSIRVECGALVTVEAEFYPDEAAEKTTTKRYNLVEISEPAAPVERAIIDATHKTIEPGDEQ